MDGLSGADDLLYTVSDRIGRITTSGNRPGSNTPTQTMA